MPEIDLADFKAEIESEREWRENEMRQFRNQLSLLSSEKQRKVARKSLVVMLYAHYEGASKALFSIYVNHINKLNLRVDQVISHIGAASLTEVFCALRDTNKKCTEFARSLPDDTTLHRFARDREFVEVAWQIAQRSVEIDVDKVVDMESNLKPVVLKKILFRLGLDPKLAQPWEKNINLLLGHRNSIAHGLKKDGLEEKEYMELEQAASSVIDEIAKAIVDAVASKAYLPADPN